MLKYFITGAFRWFPSIKTSPGLTPAVEKPGRNSSNGPSNTFMLFRPASIKFCFAIAAVPGQPSIVHTVVSEHEAAMYIVLIPMEVPNSIINGFPNSAAIFDNRAPYFPGTGENLAIFDIFLKFVFNNSDREPRSQTIILRLSEINFFLTSSILNITAGSILFLKTLETRSKTNGL